MRGRRKQEGVEYCAVKGFLVYTARHIWLWWSRVGGWDGWNMLARKGRIHWVLEGKLVGSRPIGRPRRRRDENIKVDFKDIRWGVGRGLDSSGWGEGPLVVANAVLSHRESLNPEKALTSLETASFPRVFLLHAVLVVIYLLRSLRCLIKVSCAKSFWRTVFIFVVRVFSVRSEASTATCKQWSSPRRFLLWKWILCSAFRRLFLPASSEFDVMNETAVCCRFSF
jgi:hypothetical protein